MKRVNKLFLLSPRDWLMLAMAYRWLIWARWRMWSGLLVGRKWLEQPQHPPSDNLPVIEDPDDWRVQRRVHFIGLAARYPRRWSWCLQSSLALREWLAQSGILADLRIGVQKHDGHLQAHAWLEYHGKVLNDDARTVESYVALHSSRGKLLSEISAANQETVR